MITSRPPSAELSVWNRRLATVPALCRDADWPFGRTATYRMAQRGEIPTRRIGGNILVVMSDLLSQLDLDALPPAS